MTAGLGPTGFTPATVAEILAAIEADERAALGSTAYVGPESVVGAVNQALATKLAELWELAGIVYTARDPAGATFASLDALCRLTGTQRRGETHGLVTLTLALNAGATVPIGSRASVTGQPTNLWATTEAASNPSGVPITVNVQARATEPGTIVANAGTITSIATPVSGWTAVTNALDAEPGAPTEVDPPLRARRERELFRNGTSPVDAIYADLADVSVNGVNVVASLTVEHNPSAYYDRFRRPPHTVEAVVQFTPGLAGADLAAARQAFSDQLWLSVAGGIDTVGNHTGTATDVRGVARTVRWSEPTDVNVWVTALLSVDPVAYDSSSSHAVAKAAAIAYGTLLRLGRDVLRLRLASALLAVPGVVDIVTLEIGSTAGTQHALNLSIGPRELAQFDTSRITVTTEVASEP